MKPDTRPGPQAKYSKHIVSNTDDKNVLDQRANEFANERQQPQPQGLEAPLPWRDLMNGQNARIRSLRKALETAADELKMARYFNAERCARAALAETA